jgi:hypothetical protein
MREVSAQVPYQALYQALRTSTGAVSAGYGSSQTKMVGLSRLPPIPQPLSFASHGVLSRRTMRYCLARSTWRPWG